jgi:hypothetical protein
LLDFGSDSFKPIIDCYKNKEVSRRLSVGFGLITSVEKVVAGVLWVLFGMAVRFRLFGDPGR